MNTPPTLEKIDSALAAVPPDDRDTWLRVGMALKAELGDDGFTAWDQWSQRATSYRERAARDVWRSFKTGKTTIATLFFLAKENGWRPDRESAPMSPAEIERRRHHQEVERHHQEAEKEASQRKAKHEAEQQWQVAQPVVSNWYLEAKRIKAHGLRCLGNILVVPMRDRDGDLWNLQKITQGGKRFLPGSRVSGLFHVIGEQTDTVLIAEGYATAATVHEATGHQTYVAFSCGNLMAVARIVRDLNPGKRITICADNDRHTAGNPGVTKARAAALAIGGYVAIPEFPEGVPGTDFNDLHIYRMEVGHA